MKTAKSTVLPVVALRDMVIIPNTIEEIYLGRIKSVSALKSALRGDKLIIFIPQKDPNVENPAPDDLHTIGSLVKIFNVLPLEEKNIEAYKVWAEGKNLVRVIKFLPGKKHLRCEFKRVKAAKIKIEYANIVSSEGKILDKTITGFSPLNK